MREASPALNDLLLSAREFFIADCLDLTLKSGPRFLFTGTDVDVAFPEVADYRFSSSQVSFEVESIKATRGLQVQKVQARLIPHVTNQITPLVGAAIPASLDLIARNGGLDMADVTVWRAFAPVSAIDFENLAVDSATGRYYVQATGALRQFVGQVGELGEIFPQRISLTIESGTRLLLMPMPRRTYEAGCTWDLYDAGCKAAPLNAVGKIVTGSTRWKLIVTGYPTEQGDVISEKADNYFAEGYVLFKNGPNALVRRGIKQSHGGVLDLAEELPYEPAQGDEINVNAGCDKTRQTCRDKFNNLANWFGFPFIPGPDTLMGVKGPKTWNERFNLGGPQ
jgi:uncharacterized phage protein (TIGR02218 family)